MIDQIFIFAAGAGTRMMPLTKDTPKPLLKIGEKTMIEHILDRIRFLKAKNVIINSFYLKKKIKEFAQNHQDNLIISDEFNKIETGGAVKYAIKCGLIDIEKPLLLINGDLFWKEDEGFLKQMIAKYEAEKPDILLCVAHKKEYFGYEGHGDFSVSYKGHIIRDHRKPFAFTGIQIINPKIFYHAPKEKRFSMAHFYQNKKINIKAFVSKNYFFHIDNPKSLESINKLSF